MYDDDEEDEENERSGNDSSNKSKHLKRKCMKIDHEVAKLKVCCDAGYFTNEYVRKKLIDRTGSYPKKCSDCGKLFVD